MNIICPKCGKSHKLPDNRLPSKKSAAKCKKCAARMIIYPIAAQNDHIQNEFDYESASQVESPSGEFDILLAQDRDHIDETIPPNSADNSMENDIPDKSVLQNDIFNAFPELEELSPEIFVYSEIYTAKGKRGYKNRGNTYKLKIIKAIHNILVTKLLHEDEKILRLTKGIVYYPFEIPYFNGLLTMLSNYYAIVCTSERLLFININSRISKPTRYIFQVPYSGVNIVSRGAFLSSLIIECDINQSFNFTTVNRNSAKSIQSFILEKCTKKPEVTSDDDTLQQLCPECQTPLPKGLTLCTHCSTPFKKPTEAMLRSLILPGLGSIYLSHIPLGIWEMIGYGLIWLITVLLAILEVPGGISTAIAPIIIYHLVTGLLARKTNGKGYLVEQ